MRLTILALVMLGGCIHGPCDGPAYLNFAVVHHGMFPDGSPTYGSSAPQWGGSETVDTGDELLIVFEQDATLSDRVLELYDRASGAPVTLAGVDSFVETNTEACAHKERSYALSTLALGDYTLVHRRRNGTGDPLNCVGDCPWTTHDGDTAVSLTLFVR